MKLGLIALALLLASSATVSAQRGFDLGSGIIGGIIGGVIGGTLVRPHYEPPPYYPPPYYPPPGYGNDAINYCMQRFRSYNPETGFYIGYDGRYRRCP